jgi:hypothetical protein
VTVIYLAVLGGVMVIVVANGTNVSGFKPAQERWIFKRDKNPHHDFLRTGSKAVGPIS